jgi:HK97 family phage major capsid protein
VKNLAEIAQLGERHIAGEFIDLAVRMMRSGSVYGAAALAEKERASHRIRAILKAAVAANTSVSIGDAISYQTVASAWMASLRNVGTFDRMLSSMVQVPIETPRLLVSTTVVAGYSPDEAAPKPVSRLTFTAQSLPRLKASALVVTTAELLRSASPAVQQLIDRELQQSITAATDVKFLAGLAVGVSPVASAGVTAANTFSNLTTLLSAVDPQANAPLYLVLTPAAARSLALKADSAGGKVFDQLGINGGTLAGVTVLVTDAMPGTATGMLIDASGIVAASSEVAIDVSTQAALQMADNPTNASAAGSPSTPVAAPLVSMFQTNSVALRGERFFSFAKVRTGAVASVSGNW